MNSLLYVSTSRLDPASAEHVVADIVEDSRRRNTGRQLTGALMFTGRHFAQIVEGPGDEIHRLLTALQNDTRHTGLQIIANQPLPERRFGEWILSM